LNDAIAREQTVAQKLAAEQLRDAVSRTRALRTPSGEAANLSLHPAVVKLEGSAPTMTSEWVTAPWDFPPGSISEPASYRPDEDVQKDYDIVKVTPVVKGENLEKWIQPLGEIADFGTGLVWAYRCVTQRQLDEKAPFWAYYYFTGFGGGNLTLQAEQAKRIAEGLGVPVVVIAPTCPTVLSRNQRADRYLWNSKLSHEGRKGCSAVTYGHINGEDHPQLKRLWRNMFQYFQNMFSCTRTIVHGESMGAWAMLKQALYDPASIDVLVLSGVYMDGSSDETFNIKTRDPNDPDKERRLFAAQMAEMERLNGLSAVIWQH